MGDGCVAHVAREDAHGDYGVSVGELAQALKFSGLSLFTGHDGVVEIRRVDSTTQEGEKR